MPPGPSPPDMLPQQISLLAPVVADAVPWGAEFGDVVEDVAQPVVSPGEWGCCTAARPSCSSRSAMPGCRASLALLDC